MAKHRPHVVFVCAGTVGGIAANMARQVDFLRDNIAIATSVIEAAAHVGVERMVYFGSSCIYPRNAAAADP
jgi:GDP-L-fucose synthase